MFESDYAGAFRGADHVFLTHPLRKKDDLRPDQYLDPQVVLSGVSRYVKTAQAFVDFPGMARAMAAVLRPGDIVLGMSGRDFRPLYRELFAQLKTRSPAELERSRAEGL